MNEGRTYKWKELQRLEKTRSGKEISARQILGVSLQSGIPSPYSAYFKALCALSAVDVLSSVSYISFSHSFPLSHVEWGEKNLSRPLLKGKHANSKAVSFLSKTSFLQGVCDT